MRHIVRILVVIIVSASSLVVTPMLLTQAANRAVWDLFPGAPDPRFGAVESWRNPASAADLRIGWERLTFIWSSFQPTGPTGWNAFADSFDQPYDKELRAGRSLVGLLIGTPQWAAANSKQGSGSPPLGLYLAWNDPHNYWGNFVYRIVKHFTGKINYWCIWNEISIPSGQFHTWSGSQRDYAQLVRVAYLAAKAANPAAQIVLYGEPYWYDKGAYFEGVLGALTQLPYAQVFHDYFDVANLHLYSRPKDMARVVNWMRGAIARVGIPPRPIWISETNAVPRDDTAVHRIYPKGNFNSTLDEQASFIIEAAAVDLAVGVQRIEINRLIDGPDFTNGGEPFGLVRNDGSVRPAYYAFKTVTSLMAHTTVGTYIPNSATGVYEVVLRRPGYQITVAWDNRPVPAAVDVTALASTALSVSKIGVVTPIVAQHGIYHFTLAAATDNSNLADPTDYVIGGTPIILVEKTST